MARSLQRVSWSSACSALTLSSSSSTRRHVVASVPAFLAPGIVVAACSRAQSQRHFISASSSPIAQTRHASTSSTSSSSSSSSSTSKPKSVITTGSRATQNSKLNPPASTLPPVLDTPTRQPDQSAPSYWFALGKAYIAFYKSGLKAVWNNHQAARKLRSSNPALASSGGGGWDSAKARDALSQGGQLTRADWQLVRRAQADGWRLPLFGLVLVICGEFTVLLLPVVGGIVPRTCWIPSQVTHMRRKAEKRRASSFQRADSVLRVEELGGQGNNKKVEAASAAAATAAAVELDVKSLRTAQLVHAGRSLGLYSQWWDTLWDQPPRWLLRRRAAGWARYIEADDAAIARFGGVGQLSEEELRIAMEERGVDVLNRKPEQLAATMQEWLDARTKKQQPLFDLVMTRPSVWGRKLGNKE